MYPHLNDIFLNKIYLKFDRNPVKTFIKTLIFFTTIYYVLNALLSLNNEKLKLRPKIYLWSNLSTTSDSTCRIPLNINPYDITVQEYLVNDGMKRIVCAHENTTFDWTYVDNNGIWIKILFSKLYNKLILSSILCALKLISFSFKFKFSFWIKVIDIEIMLFCRYFTNEEFAVQRNQLSISSLSTV